jgi:PEP-CTERM motif-containing protein
MTLRSFVTAGVLFIVLLAAHDIHADPIIVDGLITKTGEFSPAAIQFSATDNFSFSGFITPFASFAHPCSTGIWFHCLPGSTLQLGGIASGSDVLGTVTIGTESFRASGGLGTGSLHLVFDGGAVLPPVGEPAGLVSAPFSLTGQWAFPFVSGQEFRPGFSFSGSGTVSAFIAPSLIESPPGWRLTGLEYRFGSDLEPIPEPGTLLLMATGLAALARRQFARRSWRTESR